LTTAKLHLTIKLLRHEIQYRPVVHSNNELIKTDKRIKVSKIANTNTVGRNGDAAEIITVKQ